MRLAHHDGKVLGRRSQFLDIDRQDWLDAGQRELHDERRQEESDDGPEVRKLGEHLAHSDCRLLDSRTVRLPDARQGEAAEQAQRADAEETRADARALREETAE